MSFTSGGSFPALPALRGRSNIWRTFEPFQGWPVAVVSPAAFHPEDRPHRVPGKNPLGRIPNRCSLGRHQRHAVRGVPERSAAADPSALLERLLLLPGHPLALLLGLVPVVRSISPAFTVCGHAPRFAHRDVPLQFGGGAVEAIRMPGDDRRDQTGLDVPE
jgi:hypothetical protein